MGIALPHGELLHPVPAGQTILVLPDDQPDTVLASVPSLPQIPHP